jgi:hypothetical protein
MRKQIPNGANSALERIGRPPIRDETILTARLRNGEHSSPEIFTSRPPRKEGIYCETNKVRLVQTLKKPDEIFTMHARSRDLYGEPVMEQRRITKAFSRSLRQIPRDGEGRCLPASRETDARGDDLQRS